MGAECGRVDFDGGTTDSRVRGREIFLDECVKMVLVNRRMTVDCAAVCEG